MAFAHFGKRPDLLRSALGLVLPVVLGGFGAACASPNAASQLVRPPAFEPAGQSKCSIAKSQARPLIVEWPSADRAALEAQARHGLIAVHYEGCEMEVLRQCRGSGSYVYAPTTRQRDRVTIHDADELYANLPLGAAKLEGKLATAGQLQVAMTIVGTYEADVATLRADELIGECARATHLITNLSAGAFDFFAGADAEVTAEASVAGLGGGGGSKAKRETLNQAGDEAACERAAAGDRSPPFGCGALLRLEVVPLARPTVATPACAPGTTWDGLQCARTAPSSAPPPQPSRPPPGASSTPRQSPQSGGTLTIAARSPCNVTLDDTPAGPAPVLHARVVPGQHRVRCGSTTKLVVVATGRETSVFFDGSR